MTDLTERLRTAAHKLRGWSQMALATDPETVTGNTLLYEQAAAEIESLTARLSAAEAERDALADTCVEAADQIDTLRGLLREVVDMPRYSTRFENWRGRVTAALEGKP